MSQGMIVYAIAAVILGITFMALGDLVLGTLIALCGPLWLTIQENTDTNNEDDD